ncbi:hypothetical protein FACS1894170_04180 [Planctomycetales bacterium]|nr:hypothetical protein FACS1894170_04180 [Planctomycetales bacterium]
MELLEQGIPWQDIDRAALNFGMKHGPCTLMDEIGLDVVLHSGWILYKAFPNRVKPMPLLLQLVEQGHLGVKAGCGIRETHISDGAAAKCDDEIISFLLEPMYNEALRCYRDGIVGQLTDADLASVEALGFPPDKTGIATWGQNRFRLV